MSIPCWFHPVICVPLWLYFGSILVPLGSMLVPLWFHFGVILVPRSWYQDIGTQKKGELERRSLSKMCDGAGRAAGPPPGVLGGWKPPRNCRWSWGRQPPSKNNVWQLFVAPICSPCQHFPCRAVTRFSGPRLSVAGRAINLRVLRSVK